MTRGLWLLICAASAFGQGLRPGLKVGVPLTAYFETGQSGSLHGDAQYSAATRRYTVGASVEWQPGRLGFEVDALYHRMGYVGIVHYFNSANGSFRDSSIDVKGHSWDFPVLVKWRLGRAFVGGGGVLRYVGPVRGIGEQVAGSLVDGSRLTTPLDTDEPSELRKRVYPGVTAAAGVTLVEGRVRVTPEARYTRWTANISQPGGLLRFASNQIEVMVGVSF